MSSDDADTDSIYISSEQNHLKVIKSNSIRIENISSTKTSKLNYTTKSQNSLHSAYFIFDGGIQKSMCRTKEDCFQMRKSQCQMEMDDGN